MQLKGGPNERYLETLQQFAGLNAAEVAHIGRGLDQFSSQGLSEVIFFCYVEHTPQLLTELMARSGIQSLLPLERFQSIRQEREGLSLIAVKDSPAYLGTSPSENRRSISRRERGLSLIEGLWLSLWRPELTSNHAIDLLGAQYSLECVPTIYEWQARRYLSAIVPDVKDSMCRPLIVLGETHINRSDLVDPDGIVRRAERLIQKYPQTRLL